MGKLFNTSEAMNYRLGMIIGKVGTSTFYTASFRHHSSFHHHFILRLFSIKCEICFIPNVSD